MLEFTCPGCLSQCVANAAFVGMRARCVVCGAFIRIPANSGETARLSEEPGAAVPSAGGRSAVRPRTAGELVVLSDREEDYATDGPEYTVDEHELSVADGPVTFADDEPDTYRPEVDDADAGDLGLEAPDADAAELDAPELDAPELDEAGDGEEDKVEDDEAKADGDGLDGKLDWEDEAEAQDAEAKAAAAAKANKKRKLMIAGGAMAASVVIVLAVVFLGGEKKPDLTAAKNSSPPPADERPKVTPPPPPPEVKKEAPKKEEPKEPEKPSEPERYTLGQLTGAYRLNPVEFNKKHTKKTIFLNGTFARMSNGVFTIAETPTGPGITCEPAKRVNENDLDFREVRPGQSIFLTGTYAPELKLTECRLLSKGTDADVKYRDKELEVLGFVEKIVYPTEKEPASKFPVMYLDTFLTDCRIDFRCVFRNSEREKLALLKPGQPVTIRGKCAGRLFRSLSLEDCSLLDGGDLDLPNVIRVTSAQLVSEFELDLLSFPRPEPGTPPIVIAADQLAADYQGDFRAGNLKYWNKLLAVSGKVVVRRPGSLVIVLETGTTHKHQIALHFTPQQYAKVPDAVKLSFIGICYGVELTDNPQYIVLENCSVYDPEQIDPLKRIVPAYFPLVPDRESVYQVLTPGAAGAKEHAIRLVRVKFLEPDIIQTVALKSGVYPKASLFDGEPAQPKWTKDYTVLGPKRAPPEVTQIRGSEAGFEVRPKPPAPLTPGPFWEPIIKFGARKDEVWKAIMPDGRVALYKVLTFSRDAVGRPTVDIIRVLRNPNDPKESQWEETLITYKLGVGEVKRTTLLRSTVGGIVTLESRLVEGEPQTIDLKGSNGPKKGPAVEDTKPDGRDEK